MSGKNITDTTEVFNMPVEGPVREKILKLAQKITDRKAKVKPGDPDMDDTERVMFPDETYRCSRCKGKGYFGASCTRDRYCQRCGAKMTNAGKRGPAT